MVPKIIERSGEEIVKVTTLLEEVNKLNTIIGERQAEVQRLRINITNVEQIQRVSLFKGEESTRLTEKYTQLIMESEQVKARFYSSILDLQAKLDQVVFENRKFSQVLSDKEKSLMLKESEIIVVKNEKDQLRKSMVMPGPTGLVEGLRSSINLVPQEQPAVFDNKLRTSNSFILQSPQLPQSFGQYVPQQTTTSQYIPQYVPQQVAPQYVPQQVTPQYVPQASQAFTQVQQYGNYAQTAQTPTSPTRASYVAGQSYVPPQSSSTQFVPVPNQQQYNPVPQSTTGNLKYSNVIGGVQLAGAGENVQIKEYNRPTGQTVQTGQQGFGQGFNINLQGGQNFNQSGGQNFNEKIIIQEGVAPGQNFNEKIVIKGPGGQNETINIREQGLPGQNFNEKIVIKGPGGQNETINIQGDGRGGEKITVSENTNQQPPKTEGFFGEISNFFRGDKK